MKDKDELEESVKDLFKMFGGDFETQTLYLPVKFKDELESMGISHESIRYSELINTQGVFVNKNQLIH